jgi:hypothetical protein
MSIKNLNWHPVRVYITPSFQAIAPAVKVWTTIHFSLCSTCRLIALRFCQPGAQHELAKKRELISRSANVAV